MDEAALLEKLRLIEALHAGAATRGERVAAERAEERIRARLRDVQEADPPVEYTFTTSNAWSHKLLVALLRRYGIRPYRFKRQRYTTVMARVPVRFVDETLWPQFEQLDNTLRAYLEEVTDRVIAQAIHGDISEASEVDKGALPPAT